MATKVHFQATVQGAAACSVRSIGNNKYRNNSRQTYKTIQEENIVKPDDFRATPEEHRCAHCSGKFTEIMNRRRAANGKPLYSDAFTKTLA